MKKLPLILTVSLFIVVVGGYFLYDKVLKQQPFDPWDLVPESSVIVYEGGDCKECVDSVQQSSLWNILQRAAFYSKPSDSVNVIYDFLKGSHHTLISLHVTKKDDFDFVFYSKDDPKKFEVIFDQWKKSKNAKISVREFNAVKIQEISIGGQLFSWLFLDDVWVGSFTPFLIEDVIRTYETDHQHNFKSRISGGHQIPGTKKGAGNLYIHFKNLAEWLDIFTLSKQTALLQDFGKSSVLDIKANGTSVILNGFSTDSVSLTNYALSIFSNQNPVPFNTKKFISNRTVMLTSYGVSDGKSFKSGLTSYQKRARALNDTLNKLSTSLNFNIDQLYENIKGEIGFCLVESKGQSVSKILLVETKEPQTWLAELNKVSSKLSIDTIFYEKYSDYEIRELQLFRLPEKMFWPLVTGFDRSYYTAIGSTIIISEDIEELKKFLDDIDKEETWGKSVSQNKYLESTLLESSISMYISTPHVWNVLSGSVNQKWKKFISDNKSSLHSLGMGALQFSHLSDVFYTNVSWSYEHTKRSRQERVSQKIMTSISTPMSKMFVMKNHVDKQDEALIQDSANTIYLISSQGKVLWQRQLDDAITGNVEQVDYYNNGKLQSFFATRDKLHIIDRLGNYVQPFPITVPTDEIEHASIIDYDHSRKYRFLVASKSGKLWMYDKEGNNLEGWKPKNLESGFALAPQHHRIRGKDYILCIRKDGKVFMLNRRGETLKNFPLNLDARPSGDYFLETGLDLERTHFVVVSRDGYKIKFNLEGKIQSRETLLKNSPLTQFSLVKEYSGKTYSVVRQEAKQLVLMDDSGKEIITNDFIGLDPVLVQYNDFGGGKTFITVVDTHQDLSFVYDLQGNLLTTPPLESYFAVPRYSDQDKSTVFIGYKNSLIIQPLGSGQ